MLERKREDNVDGYMMILVILIIAMMVVMVIKVLAVTTMLIMGVPIVEEDDKDSKLPDRKIKRRS